MNSFKNESECIKFYEHTFTNSQLVTLYSVEKLMQYYEFGAELIFSLNYIIKNNLFEKYNVTSEVVINDKKYYQAKVDQVKNIIESKCHVQIMAHEFGGSVLHLN